MSLFPRKLAAFVVAFSATPIAGGSFVEPGWNFHVHGPYKYPMGDAEKQYYIHNEGYDPDFIGNQERDPIKVLKSRQANIEDRIRSQRAHRAQWRRRMHDFESSAELIKVKLRRSKEDEKPVVEELKRITKEIGDLERAAAAGTTVH